MSEFIGKILSGRYRVDAFLGKGGMAMVYKVWDQRRSVYLAMKILHEDLAEDKVFLRRFQREAQTLETLQHPHIVRFYGMERDDDLVFILMDFVEGTTLRKEIFKTNQPFTSADIVHILRPVCSALHYAHESGFIHCDIKPANIMIHNNGTVLVADFGIARLTESATMTLTGAGTPAYMAPEQARGENPIIETDIYALGVILFELVTGGERPFTGEHARTTGSTSEKIRWEQLNLRPPSPRAYNPGLSPDLSALIVKCLNKDPKKRFNSSLDLLQAFEQCRIESLRLSKKDESSIEHIRNASPAAQDISPKIETHDNPPSPSSIPSSHPENKVKESNLLVESDTSPETLRTPITHPPQAVIGILHTEPQQREAIYPAIPKISFQSLVPILDKYKWFIAAAAMGLFIFLLAVFSGGSRSNASSITPLKVSSNSAQLYFTSNRDGKQEIYKLTPNGMTVQVTHSSGDAESWGLMPDGLGNLYFTSDRDGKKEIYKLSPDAITVQVTNSPGNTESWGLVPDGLGNLYFTSNRDGKQEIYKLTPEADTVRVTDSPGNTESWGLVPDGLGNLYFTSNRDGKKEIYKLSPDATTVRVTHSPGNAESWGVMPDGLGNLYFTSNRDGKEEIYKLTPNAVIVRVTHSPGDTESWGVMPDGLGNLYFTSNRDGKQEIYKLTPDAKTVRVTHSPGNTESWGLMPDVFVVVRS